MSSPFTDILVKAFDHGYERARQVKGLADEHYIVHQETMVEEAEQAIKAAIAEAIGEDIPCHDPVTGKEVKLGEAVTIDVDNHLKESLVFIESNGKNNIKREIRAKLGIEKNKTPEPKGLVGNLYGITVRHQNYVGDTREHIEPLEQCWCWEENKNHE